MFEAAEYVAARSRDEATVRPLYIQRNRWMGLRCVLWSLFVITARDGLLPERLSDPAGRAAGNPPPLVLAIHGTVLARHLGVQARRHPPMARKQGAIAV